MLGHPGLKYPGCQQNLPLLILPYMVINLTLPITSLMPNGQSHTFYKGDSHELRSATPEVAPPPSFCSSFLFTSWRSATPDVAPPPSFCGLVPTLTELCKITCRPYPILFSRKMDGIHGISSLKWNYTSVSTSVQCS